MRFVATAFIVLALHSNPLAGQQPAPVQPPGSLIDSLAKSHYLGAASLVMEGFRRLHGAQEGASDPTATWWAPYFAMPTEATRQDLNALLPLVTEMVTLQAAVASSANAFDRAWDEAAGATSQGSEEGTRQALAMAAMHKAQLEGQQARLAQLAAMAKTIGPLRDPLKQYQRVVAEHEAALRTLRTLAIKPASAVLAAPCTNPYGDCEIKDIQHVNVGNQPKALINPIVMMQERQEREAYERCLKEKKVDCKAPGSDAGPTVQTPSPVTANPGPATATQRQQRISEIDANLAIIQQHMSRDQAELDTETDTTRRASLQFRLLQAKSDLQAEQDLKTSFETGQMTHTRSPFDEYAHDQFVEQIQTTQQGMDQFQRASEGLQRLAYMLPSGEADLARAFIARQITATDRSQLNIAKLRQIGNALSLKVQGFQQLAQAKDDEAAARASMYLEMSQNIKSAADGGMQACSLFGGRALSLAYSAGTGFAEGGGTGALIQAAASLTTPTSLALTAFQGYQEGGWSGAGQSLAISYVTGKATTYGLRKAMSVGARPPVGAMAVKEGMELARFKQSREYGIALAKDFQKTNAEAYRLSLLARRGDAAAARSLAQIEKTLETKAQAIQEDAHAKGFLKYKGDFVTQKAFNKSLGTIHAKVEEQFHKTMEQEMKWSPVKLQEFRNTASAGTVGMDYDIGLAPAQARLLIQGGKRATQFQWQTDAQQAWNKAYKQVTGRSADRSWETVTTSVHPEAYGDLKLLDGDMSKVSKVWAGQTADVTRYKMWHLSNNPHLSDMEKLQEISRGTSKDMATKLLPLLKLTPSNSAASADAMSAAKQHWTKVNSVLEAFGKGDIDPIYASRRIRELTGGKSIREVVDQSSTLMESLIKRIGQ